MEGIYLYDVRETERAREREIKQQSIETVHFFLVGRVSPRRPAADQNLEAGRLILRTGASPSAWRAAAGSAGFRRATLHYHWEPRKR